MRKQTVLEKAIVKQEAFIVKIENYLQKYLKDNTPRKERVFTLGMLMEQRVLLRELNKDLKEGQTWDD